MGRVTSNLHKRRKSGAKRKIHRLKKNYETARQPSLCKLGGHKVTDVRVRGGNLKQRALRLSLGNFAWGSEGIAKKARILDVVYSPSNNEYVRTKTIVRGVIVTIDAAPFRRWYEQNYNQNLTRISSDVQEESALSATQKNRFESRRKNHAVDEELRKEFGAGRVYACVSARPGQVGRADGYVLEGPELEFLVKKLAQKKKGKGTKKA
eukprot:CAMPEP_0117451274 /NCGR_PEP_ID=MMETSP0759-20121206/8919_1 /TAXON_ID=63605 /ORGANISM="Percolomonas cosmopolitus, Strain WS" /LENGTH=207 /DNA_ID=CAMNT_0005243861 /DNA_START=42 /DNA_END=665 /DNA_ORIENTATION=+